MSYLKVLIKVKMEVKGKKFLPGLQKTVLGQGEKAHLGAPFLSWHKGYGVTL